MPSTTTASFDAFRATSRFGSLDGLRAASVLAVVWHHTGAGLVAAPWAQVGHHGVTLFFAISGFLITTLLLREHDRFGCIDLRAFYIRRALRIFPLYYAVLLAYVVLVFALERHSPAGKEFFSNLKYFATYTSNLFVALDGRTIFYFSWSLAAEEQFYLVWPPLLKKLGTRTRALAAIAVVVVLLAVLEVALPWIVGADAARATQAALRKVPLAIVAGVGAALVLHDPRSFERWRPWLAGSRWHSAAWAAIALACLWLDGGVLPWAALHLSFALLVAACCMREDHVLAPLLRWQPMAYVGSISYGLYLLHMLCKNALVKAVAPTGFALGPWTMFAGTALLSVIVAGLSFRWFETPFLRAKVPFERVGTAGLRPA
jgi:peptidoglycan/LPS O-acetylase OafA/YrhL